MAETNIAASAVVPTLADMPTAISDLDARRSARSKLNVTKIKGQLKAMPMARWPRPRQVAKLGTVIG